VFIYRQVLNATTKKGAVPIILIDGMMIIDIMIEKKFGIEIEDMPIYINALDVVLGED
jgi:restriction system protein